MDSGPANDYGNEPHSYPGTSMDDLSPRYTLYEKPSAKTCYFYRDGYVHQKPLKVAINPRQIHDVEVLKDELTRKVPGLPFGVRSIYTPQGRDHVASLDDLQDSGSYVCSTHRNRARGVDLARITQFKSWHRGRPDSGRRAFNAFLRDSQREQIHANRRRAWGKGSREHSDAYASRIPKKITVLKNGDPSIKYSMLIYRKTSQTFEQILDDMCAKFDMPVRKLFSLDGRPVQSLSAIMNGPDVFVASSNNTFKPQTAMSEPVPLPRRQERKRKYDNDMIAQKLKDKRDRISRTRGKWKVLVTTNELPSAGTQAQVTLTVYGHRGSHGPIPLTSPTEKGDAFQAGSSDEFDISVGNIGDIYKIRIGHDNSKDFPGWFCDEVLMTDEHTGEELKFECGRWMSREEDDSEICRELPAVRSGETVLPVLKYVIEVTTGDVWNAATQANVYITLYGERGDTGVRQLFKHNNSKCFSKGQRDVFSVEAVSLGDLKRVIVGHDGAGPGYGWFLEKIVVKESTKSRYEYVFPCGRWLDEGEDDQKIVRELKPLDEYNKDILEKKMFEYEKWKFQPGNQVLLYSKTTQLPLRIKPDASIDACGDYKDDFGVIIVGSTKKEMVKTLQSKINRKFHLAIDNNKILGQGRGGSYCEFRVRVQDDRSVMFESCKYPLQCLTLQTNGRLANPRETLPDVARQFFVFVKGMLRDRGIILFNTSAMYGQALNIDHNNRLFATGKRNKLAHFRIHKVHEQQGVRMFESLVFPKQFIRMRDGAIDVMGKGDSYCHFRVKKLRELGHITLESVSNRGIFLGMTADGQVKPTVDTGDKNVWLYPEVIEFGRPSKKKIEEIPAKVPVPRHRSPTPVQSSVRSRSPTPVRQARAESESKHHSPESQHEDGEWKVWVSSAEAAENTDIAMVVYGDKGSSGRIILGNSSNKELFQAGNVDEFKINIDKVGTVYKIRMELHAIKHRKEPSWKVKEVKMKDLTTKETLKFKFNRWLSSKHDDGDIMRELPAVRPKKKVLPVLTYHVEVHTGREPGSDTDANVFINLFGERGDTGRRHLLHSNNKVKFQEGKVDKFELEAVDLGALIRCVISHDGDGAGEGWFCDKVIVKDSPEAKNKYVFPCHRWLDSGIDDKKTERVLRLHGASSASSVDNRNDTTPKRSPEPKEKPKEGDWDIWVTTGSGDKMSTVNEVSIVAYGDKGVSKPAVLASGRDTDYFDRGATDQFRRNIEDLGEWYKVRIGHSDTDRTSGWFLDSLKMKNCLTEEQFSFKVKRWLSREEDDHDVWRELPVVIPKQKPLPVITYYIEVHTGSEPGADTEAELYIQLVGLRGDSGERLLYKSLNNDTPFQEGQVDMFVVEAVSLDEVTKVKIGHHETGKGAGWYCEKVFIREGDSPDSRTFYFPCNHWFDSGLDDHKTERTLTSAPLPKESRGEYSVVIKTARDSKPSNNSIPIFTVYAEKGKSRDFQFDAQDQRNFAAGSEAQFEIAIGDLGEPYKIRIGRADDDNWEGWHLAEVIMHDKDTGEDLKFPVDRWMARDMDDYDIVRELPVVRKGHEPLPIQRYKVDVYIGDHWAADTDARVFITLHGSKGDTGKRCLFHSFEDNKLKFQRHQMDSFILEAVSVQELRKLVISHDGEGHGAGMYVDKVIVTAMEGHDEGQTTVFPCYQWLDDHEGDKKTTRELKPAAVTTEEETIEAKQGTKTQGEWRVKVRTGDLVNANTKAQPYVTVYGIKGTSKPLPLGKPNSDKFQRAKEAEFKIQVGDIGDLYKVRVEHDNSGSFPSWFLQEMTLTDVHTEEQHILHVNRWLAEDEDDGQLCREVAVFRKGQPPPPLLKYQVYVYTGEARQAGTEANVEVAIHGDMGDTGWCKLTDSRYHNLKWIPGQVDTFTVEAVSLGKLTKIDVRHDGKNRDSSWFLDQIVVRESEHALSEFVFPCHEWIEGAKKGAPPLVTLPSTGERLIEALPDKEALLMRQDDESTGRWMVWTYTGQESSPPLEATVFLTVVGSSDVSDPIPLENKPSSASSKRKGKAKETSPIFLPGMRNEFPIDIGEVGEISKIRISLDQRGRNPSWYLDRIKIKDDVTKQEFHFNYDGWIQRSEADQELFVELPAIRPDIPPPDEVLYEVSLKTGSCTGAESDAHIYCILSGSMGDTGKRHLITSKNNDKTFKRAQLDVFEVRALDIGVVRHITLGHTARGRGRGWFCDSAVVKCGAESTSALMFPCSRWFDSTLEDKRIERILKPIATVPVRSDDDDTQDPSGVYKAFVKTADPNNSNNYNNNNSNNNNNNLTVDSDEEDDLNSNNCNNKAKSKRGQSRKSEEPRREIVVFAYGTTGSAGPIPLDNGDEDLFAPGKEEEFDLHVGDIGNIYKLRVCDGSSAINRLPWIVTELMLEDVKTKDKLVFDFSEFVGETEGDHCKELPAIQYGQDILSVVDYLVTFHTTSEESDSDTSSKKRKSKSDKDGKNKGRGGHKRRGSSRSRSSYTGDDIGDVWLNLYGSRGDSGARQLVKLTPLQNEEFVIRAVDLDNVNKVVVTKHPGSPWDLDSVVIKKGEYADIESVFEYKDVIGEDGGAELTEVELLLSGKRKTADDEEYPESKGRWRVTTLTNTHDSATPNGTVAVILKSKTTQSSPCFLKSQDPRHEDFAPGATDEFLINVEEDLGGDVEKVLAGFIRGSNSTTWFLDSIKFEDLDTDDQFIIDYSGWIENEAGWTELVVPWPDSDHKLSQHIYYVDVYTGSDENASTNEELFIRFIGNKTKSPDIVLTPALSTSRNTRLFQQGQVDKFIIETDEIIDLEKVYMGHRGKNKGDGWQLDKVVVTDSQNRRKEHVFPCNRWFDVGEDDGATEREVLMAEEDEPEIPPPTPDAEGAWKVVTVTDKESGMTDGADVVMVIYGNKGKTEELPLSALDGKRSFEAGSTDKFMVDMNEDIGDIYKVRIGYSDHTRSRPSWGLRSLQLTQVETGEEYLFEYEGSVSMTESEDGWVELPVKCDEPEDTLPVIRYQVLVQTGEKGAKATDPGVYVLIEGQRGDTGKRKLLKSLNNAEMFTPGATDMFEIEAVDLIKPTEVTIGHHDKGQGHGLYVEHVIVRMATDTQTEYFFPCNRWLDEGEDDGETERVLVLGSPPDGEGVWNVVTVTDEGSNVTADDEIVMVIYGDEGKTDELPLVTTDRESSFEPGNTDNFKVKVKADIGKVYKVRVGYSDRTKTMPSWKLSSLRLTNAETGEEYLFEYEGSVSMTESEDGWVELPVKCDEPEDTLPVIRYQVLVQTGEKGAKATDPGVYVLIEGQRGDTGKRKLLKSRNNAEMFTPGTTDMFEIEAVDLIRPTEVTIGHDGKGKGHGLYVEHVIVRVSTDTKTEYFFPCKRWLDEGEDDGETERVLALGPRPDEVGLWNVVTVTDEGSNMMDDAEVVMVIYGDKGKTEELPLITSDRENCFEAGNTDNFKVVVKEDIGKVYKVRLGYNDDTKSNPSWKLKSLQLTQVETGEEYLFEYEGSVSMTESEDGWVELPVKCDEPEDTLPVVCYQVLVQTRDRGAKATDPGVYVLIEGQRGDTGKRKLLKSRNNAEKFTPGSTDMFEIEAVDLIEPSEVTLGLTDKGQGHGLYVDHIIVRVATDTKTEYFFPCNRWLDEGEDDGKTERVLALGTLPEKEATSESKKHWKVIVISGEYDQQSSPSKDKSTNKSKSKSPDKGRGKSESPSDPDEGSTKPLVPPTTNIVMAIYGDRGHTDHLPLVPLSDEQMKFSPGKPEEFEVEVSADIEFGDIYKVRMGFSEETEEEQNWPLEKVLLRDEDSDCEYEFMLNKQLDWSAVSEGWREIPLLPPIPPQTPPKKRGKKPEEKPRPPPLPVRIYNVDVHTSDISRAGTDANVYITVFGKRGDSGKRKLLQSPKKTKMFEQAQVDSFEIEAVDLSDLQSVVLGHDGKGIGSGWHVEKVIITCDDLPEERWVFLCNKWLDENEDDGLTERKLDVQEAGEKWRVDVVTGSEEGSSCRGPATIVLYGDKGHSEPVQLGDEDVVFQQGETQTFDIQVFPVEDADEIGALYKVRLGFDERDGDLMWNVHQLTAVSKKQEEAFVFEGGLWVRLDDNSDSWREFPVQEEDKDKILPVNQYVIEVFTGDSTGGGTDARVHIQLFGERGDTGKRYLLQSREAGPMFESGKRDEFTLEAVDLGSLKKIHIGHNGSGFGAGWYLDRVTVKESDVAADKYVFECKRWLDEGEDDGLIERDLDLTRVIAADDDPPEDGDWRVLITTSDLSNAGTNAQVTLTVFGDKGDSGPLPLGEPDAGFFDTDSTDQFDIMLDPDEVGKIWKIRIEHDNREDGCGWHVDKLVFIDRCTEERLEFPVNRWLDEDEDDGDRVRELPAVYPDEDPLPVTKYTLKTFTGDKFGAGTDSKVFITLIGAYGDSGKRPLNISSNGRNKFESGQTDSFSVEAVGLGPLRSVIIGHDGQGAGSGWYLDKITVKEGDDGDEAVFPCDSWLDEDEGDGKTERELVRDPPLPDDNVDDNKRR